ncbi:MAG TPA: electron transfer flavoprotein subunit alpha/FixB family protein [Gaiellales bacterium]|nr:electron transfer flavoprotein subunit alpha/FixB family protein [Gaiellales bacterium]
MSSVLVLVEHDGAAADDLSRQAATLARGYAEAAGVGLEAILIGPGAADAAAGLGELGVAKAHVAEHDGLSQFAPQAWGRTIAGLAGRLAPAAVVGPGSERAAEVMAHAAAIADLPFAANCISAAPGDPAAVTRVRWGGSLLEEARLHGATKLLTVAAHAVEATPAAAPAQTEVAAFTPELADADLAARVVERAQTDTGGGISLADAKVVVSGGRGAGSAEGFAAIEELAGLLGGAVGCSRAVTIAGWRPHTDQVGQTGTKIAPEIYIPCGISGATQHMAGCKGAKRILAINTDPDAPMIANADYAVIGDLHEVVPAIVAALKARGG